MSSYYVPLPDLAATFESLNDDSKRLIVQFVGNKSYVTYAGINKHCKEIYLTTEGMTKETFVYGYGTLSVIKDRYDNSFSVRVALGKGVVFYNRRDVLDWTLQRQNIYSLKGICNVAGEEGRLDLLEEVWDKLEDFDNKRKYIFYSVDDSAAFGGKLDVLKWLETKSTPISNYLCSNKAVRGGHLHILQWLKEEKGWKVSKGMYHSAADGGQLHVMKWLREQSCPWGEYTFMRAAKEGNMSILQWLHNEGCPWLEGDFEYFIHEEDLKPEVIEWLRANGYGNRII